MKSFLFPCRACRDHALAFLAAAPVLPAAEWRSLAVWRLHLAASQNVREEKACAGEPADRRWPPSAACSDCWHDGELRDDAVAAHLAAIYWEGLH